MPHLRDALAGLGFARFARTTNGQPLDLVGLRIMIVALVAPTDGPIGDSGLAVDDGRVKIFNQNDSRPLDLEPLASFGAFDGHFLQYSGAIWYPMVYDFPPRMKQTLGRKKRQNEMARAKLTSAPTSKPIRPASCRRSRRPRRPGPGARSTTWWTRSRPGGSRCSSRPTTLARA
jgi:hypothetical protein